ncbi:MAG: helix-turn-helix transcriptional regulator [Planctomycetia bacterium]
MQTETPSEPLASDAPLLDMLRIEESAGISELEAGLGVTATAVRQRLDRLMRAGVVERKTVSHGRGRPSHVYSLTEKGSRLGGDNFQDLALVLWREIRDVREPEVRRGLLGRIGSAMAGLYRRNIRGSTPEERLKQAAEMLRERQISCGVSANEAGRPVLTSYTCPYPELAEQDRGICAVERQMLEDLAGVPVQLSECRLDGAGCCRFTAGIGVDDRSTTHSGA